MGEGGKEGGEKGKERKRSEEEKRGREARKRSEEEKRGRCVCSWGVGVVRGRSQSVLTSVTTPPACQYSRVHCAWAHQYRYAHARVRAWLEGSARMWTHREHAHVDTLLS